MKVTIERKEIKKEEVDVEFPIYSCVDDGYESHYYVKLDEDKFTKIEIKHTSYEIMMWKSNNLKEIAAVWWDNQCAKEEWEEQLGEVKFFLEGF